MTKNKARAVAMQLDCQCDEPYMFAVKVGTGCLSSVKNHGDKWAILTIFINLIEQTMNSLKKHQQAAFKDLLCAALLKYLNDNSEPPRIENLSGKQLAKRIKHNDLILNALEDVL